MLKFNIGKRVDMKMVKIYGFCGVMGSGKGYECQKLIDNENFIKIDFGDGLREMVWRMLCWQPKNDEEYDLFKKGKINIPNYGKLDGRLLLQLVGTDTMRKVDNNFWVKECKRKIDEAISKGYSNICISDVRFKNELEMLFDYGWKADIKITFCDFHSNRYNPNSEHESEKLAQKLLSLGYKDQQRISKDILNQI